jgi:F-type H+-transporting ATPase subunit b
MPETSATTNAVTEAPAPKGGGFPPFKTETFPSQLFWLAITFSILFVVLWRVAGPRIQGVIAERRKHIASDIGAAEKHRREAEEASAAYQAALGAARLRAQGVAEENRKRIAAEVERAKALADAEAQKATSAAEARIAQARNEAKGHVAKAAQDAAIEIVARLTGEAVSPEDAAAAVRSADGS